MLKIISSKFNRIHLIKKKKLIILTFSPFSIQQPLSIKSDESKSENKVTFWVII